MILNIWLPPFHRPSFLISSTPFHCDTFQLNASPLLFNTSPNISIAKPINAFPSHYLSSLFPSVALPFVSTQCHSIANHIPSIRYISFAILLISLPCSSLAVHFCSLPRNSFASQVMSILFHRSSALSFSSALRYFSAQILR